jgi:hypothetical protein
MYLRESIIGNFLIEKANERKKGDSFSDLYMSEIPGTSSTKNLKQEKRVSFKKEISQTPNLVGFKLMPGFFMGTPTILNAYMTTK